MGNWASHGKHGTYDHHSHINQSLSKALMKNEPLLSHLFVNYPKWLFKPRPAAKVHVISFINTRPHPIVQQGLGAQTLSHSLAV